MENWPDLFQGLDGEPDLSLALVEPLVDWDSLRIVDNQDEEGRIEIVDDEVMYELLGFRADDEEADKARKAASKASSQQNADTCQRTEEIDTTGAVIEVDDYLPGERTVVHDPNWPNMDLGIVYSNMKEFRLAVRQFAINKEFELRVVKTDPERYIGGCKGGEDCPWHLVGRRQPDRCTVMVTVVVDKHTCESSARRKTTTPTSAWVASKAIHHLRKKTAMGPKELQKKLYRMTTSV